MDLKTYLIHFQALSPLDKKKELATVDIQNNLIDHMLIHIGSPDPQLRDTFIYSTWCDLIGSIDWLSQEQLLYILNKVTDEHHLFYNIDLPTNDSVFTRSFSLLVIPLLLEHHKQKPFLPTEQLKQLCDTVIRYLQTEQDIRGHITDKGWAHAIAHGADALESLASCSLPYEQYVQILHTIGDVVSRYETYTHLEEERLATALTTLLTQSRLHSDDWNRWLDHLIHWKMTSQYEREYQRISNVKNILSSLYFRLDRSDALNPAQNPWMESIKQHIHLLMKPVL
ncbi:DUF2785 domain-containing protein [Paenibacillus sp. WLX2291]|uniref:DUF2785 domain-containing protein n=1 Tax=Paenibacillus sp. WLX2291 TaxID=3296934 RepID=UPI0039843CC9